jgi:CheY-like chemotaxis protein
MGVPSVLVVDDEPQLRQMLRLLIERDGRCSVCGEAGDGLHAMELIETHDPDLVLLDLAMPVMDGMQVLAELQGRPRPSIVVLTGHPDREAQALELGAFDVLLKGPQFDRLLDTLAAAVPPPWQNGDGQGPRGREEAAG